MTISSLLLFSQSFNNSLSQLLTSPFISLRKFPNFPPTIKSTTYSPSYLHHWSSLCYRRSSAPAHFNSQLLRLDSVSHHLSPSPDFTSALTFSPGASILFTESFLSNQELLQQLPIREGACRERERREGGKERINFLSLLFELAVSVFLKL